VRHLSQSEKTVRTSVPSHKFAILCHPDRSEAEWRDLVFSAAFILDQAVSICRLFPGHYTSFQAKIPRHLLLPWLTNVKSDPGVVNVPVPQKSKALGIG
jgi:hypothetical protein